MSIVPKKSEQNAKQNSSVKSSDAILGRRSKELVIGICGAIGSGAKRLHENLKSVLEDNGYIVVDIRLSDLIIKKQTNKSQLERLTGYERYDQLQKLGNDLRNKYNEEVLAELAIQEIAIQREIKHPSSYGKIKEKIAYIIDQFKNPKEVSLFRLVYPSNFYLIGLLRTEIERESNLRSEGISDPHINKIMEKDRKDTDAKGQHVLKTLHLSDYFIRNIDENKKLQSSVKRFIDLIHGGRHITPNLDEQGMFSAYSASLRSACLSRQVGAAIMNDDGDIIATGCNDVPKSGGGLYSSSSITDHRCYNSSGCQNDIQKNILKDEIKSIIFKKISSLDFSNKVISEDNVIDIGDVKVSPETITESILSDIFENTKAKSIIEYSRAVHAEMDAITSLARNSSISSVGSSLYCTTYPCHICTRHIIAAGIKRVVFIEPYEKSLAQQLHGDSICHSDLSNSVEKVSFENFEGVSYRRYSKFFAYNQYQPKKVNGTGKPIHYPIQESHHIDSQFLDSYFDYESKITELVDEKFNE